MENLFNSLNDLSNRNIIYTTLLISTVNDIADLKFFINPLKVIQYITMSLNATIDTYILPEDQGGGLIGANYGGIAETGFADPQQKPSLLIRLAQRLALYSNSVWNYMQSQLNEHTATSIASFSVLIIVLSIICCLIISIVREEERRIKEQYKKLNTGSSSSFAAIQNNYSRASASTTSPTSCGSYYHPGRGYQKIGNQQLGASALNGAPFLPSATLTLPKHHQRKLRLLELRRETYFGLVRLLKPGCRTIVLFCDAQSRLKLLTRYYQCVYPYRKNKTLQFAFLLIEKNIGWYRDLLRLALGEKRDLQINPINCIGTVLVLNGFKKHFSVYHASDSRCDPDEPLVLLEESLLDNLSEWLEKLFAGKISRYYVSYWPDRMR